MSYDQRPKEEYVPQEPSSRWAAAAQAAESGHRGSFAQSNNRSWQNVDEELEDYDDGGWLDRKTQKVQNDSLASTRRAVERLNEADMVATRNLEMLAQQSEQLHKAESTLDNAQSNVKVSSAKADHLKSLNKLFFLPSFGGKKSKKREEAAKKEAAEREQRVEERKRQETERAERVHQMQNVQGGRYTSSAGNMYSTPDGLERDATEEEIDGNLDTLSAGLSKLRMMGQLMNTELDSQTQQVGRLTDRSEITNANLRTTQRKVDRILNN
ncbi:hypothetical protein DFS34DRAFT_581218 [Phlyctochytrium arcticum]|nr:hypothetical protein DFS34DRAFT_581218 [Phlyctochytrium arcticum]